MQEISGSLSEVIRAYSDHNLLVPAATDVQLNPFYKYHVEEVAVDLSENSGDIFKVGSVKTGKTDSKGNDIWQDTYSLSKPLLNKLAMAAGIQFNPHQTYGRRIDSITYRAQAQGAMRKADGTYRSEVDQKEICLEDEEDKYRTEFSDKAVKGITDKKAANAAAEIFKGSWVDTKDNEAWTSYISSMVMGLRAECHKTSILMAHYTVPGCNMESGQTSFFTNFEPVIPREALEAAGYEAVLLGHIHRPQILNGLHNVFYSGAINAMNFNDEGQERGFWIHEFSDTGKLTKGHNCITPYRRFYTITWDTEEVEAYIREGVMYLHRLGFPEDVTDKIVRVRYSCTSEQKKQLNIPALQKDLYELGAFYVADIEAENAIDVTNRGLLSEESDPTLNLKKYLEEKCFKNPDKIVELAEPIIAEAMKQSTTAEIHGVFRPISIAVRNYRNYKEEKFDFADISFCTINGVNGAGKSSLFMDAIVDCLFEETREGDNKAWIRGTEDARSGSIEFVFDMDKYGISLTDSEGNMKSLRGVIDNLRGSLGGLSETEQTAAASTIFGKEAMAGMLAIINASEEDYNKLSTAIDNSKDAAEGMADTMLDNLKGSFTLMQSAIEGTENAFGKRLSPYLRDIAGGIADAMPGITDGINAVMDVVDDKIAGVKRKITDMTSSDEWKNTDLFGKIDIAWDSIIAKPFGNWVSGDGAQLISTGLGTLFSSASAILPGGEKAGLTSWLSAGILAKGAATVAQKGKSIVETLSPIGDAIGNITEAAGNANDVMDFVGNLSSMIPVGAKVGLAAAGITAAIIGIKLAIDKYNQTQLENSLEEHFGKIKLSADEVKDAAAGILNQKYLTNVELALNEVQNADNLRAEAQKALESNDVLEFKSRVGITLTADEQAKYNCVEKNTVRSGIRRSGIW